MGQLWQQLLVCDAAAVAASGMLCPQGLATNPHASAERVDQLTTSPPGDSQLPSTSTGTQGLRSSIARSNGVVALADDDKVHARVSGCI